MMTPRELEYQAQYQRRRRAQARAAGNSQLNLIVPGDLVARLDQVKRTRGLTNRNDALALVLKEYFGGGETKGTSP